MEQGIPHRFVLSGAASRWRGAKPVLIGRIITTEQDNQGRATWFRVLDMATCEIVYLNAAHIVSASPILAAETIR